MRRRADTFPYEDRGMKYAGQNFGKELMPCMGLAEPVSVAPTEIIELEIRQMYEDFNYVMRDGSWSHFEFQSRDGGVEDLKRFRQYEASVSNAYGVAVTTYVVYTGNVRNPVTSFTEGVNTYRIVPILMGEKDGDQVIAGVQEKLSTGEPITKEDLVPLVLTPLMSGTDRIEVRIRTILELLKESEKRINEELKTEDIKKIESIVYAFANKFLNPVELEHVEEVLKMSLLGQMIFEDGVETGMKRGMETGIKRGMETGMKRGMETGMKRGMEKSMVKIVTTMLKKNKTVEEIHEDTDIPIEQILKIKESLDNQE